MNVTRIFILLIITSTGLCANGFAGPCEWEMETPWADLNAVWGASSSDLVIAGNAGTVMHYDGSSWSVLESPVYKDLYGVWGFSTPQKEVFAVGFEGAIINYNGTMWNDMSVDSKYQLSAVWGDAPTNVYAVGWKYETSNYGVILRYDGMTWSETYSEMDTRWTDILGFSGDNIYVVGSEMSGTTMEGRLLHFDGSTWLDESCPSTLENTLIDGISSLDMVISGYDFSGYSIFHYDGSSWTQIWSSFDYTIRDLREFSSTDVYIFGGKTYMSPYYHTKESILRYDGITWSEVFASTEGECQGTWAFSPDDMVVSCRYGSIVRCEGSTWKTERISHYLQAIGGFWGTADNDVYAAGYYEHNMGTIIHYDGVSWTPVFYGMSQDLQGIWGNSPTDIYAVGWNSVIVHFDGSTWSIVHIKSDRHLFDIWGDTGSNIYAVGLNVTDNCAVILHYDGTSWTDIADKSYLALNSIWGYSATDIFAVGSDSGTGTFLIYDGSTWKQETSTLHLPSAVWGTTPDNVFSVTLDGSILYYEGTTWTELVHYSGHRFFDIWGTDSAHYYVSGEYNTGMSYEPCILHYNGKTYSIYQFNGMPLNLGSIWGASDACIFSGGFSGSWLHYSCDSVVPVFDWKIILLILILPVLMCAARKTIQ